MSERADQFIFRPRAVYACDPKRSRGRLVLEPMSGQRTEFQRDRDRIIHSTAFRRLKHKTQVFIEHEGDHYRTRLTHSLEVAQIARSIARPLGLDEDLAEALALAHDLGHSPFGHAGERALQRLLADDGGFDHNAQSLRIVAKLERRYPLFDGLNLTWEMREGLVKHNGPLFAANSDRSHVPRPILLHDQQQSLDLSNFSSAEAQAAAIADDIAYNAHDLDDGLRAGLFGLDELRSVALLGDLLRDVQVAHPTLDTQRAGFELTRRLITVMIGDVLTFAQQQIAKINPAGSGDVRTAGMPVVALSDEMDKACREIKAFLGERMYHHAQVKSVMVEAERVVERLFSGFIDKPEALPSEWREALRDADGHRMRRKIGDYIAGMTDRYALQEYERLFDEAPLLR